MNLDRIYVGQRVRHPIAGFGRVVKLGTGRRKHTATIQYEVGPRNPRDDLPPRGIAYISDLKEADDPVLYREGDP